MSLSIAVLARLALCAVFLVSAGSKLTTAPARTAFAEAVTVFGAMPARWSRAAAGLVVVAEVAVAVGLCVNQLSRPALYGAAALLLVFAIALWAGLRRGVMMPCACFGASQSPARPPEIWRNLLLAALALIGAIGDGAPTALLGGPAAAVVDRLLIAAFVTVLAAGFSDFTDILNLRRAA
jgi:uncharacterized membrane protein YphA (DoxX/SURF4 family)